MKNNTEPQNKTDKKPASSLQLIKRLLGLAWTYRADCIKILAINATMLVMGIYGLGLMGVGIDFIRFHLAGQATVLTPEPGIASLNLPNSPKPPHWPLGLEPPSDWQPMTIICLIAGSVLGLALLRAIPNFMSAVESNKLSQGKIVVNLRAKVYDRMQRLSFSFFDNNTTSSMINRVTGDVQSVRLFIDGVVLQIVMLILTLAMYLTYMIRIHPGLTMACLATTPILWIMTAYFSRKVKPAYMENRNLFDRLILRISENVQGMHVVKGFARQQEQINRFGEINNKVRDQQFWIFKHISIYQPLIVFLTQINIVVMLLYGGFLVMKYEQAPDSATAVAVGLSIGQLLVFGGLLQQFSGQIANIANIANSIQQSLIGAQRVFEVFDTPIKIKTPENAVRLKTCHGNVSFSNVSFSYDINQPVLTNISFDVKAGECAAILGQTGSGKSTLLSLIPRFYDPDSGTVTLDGVDLRKLDLDDIRSNIGIVFQESFIFSNTVAANIAFGHPAATREQVEKAARTACAHDFITDLPKGYDTILRDGGTNLSGGQRQRIAIARAILLEPRVLLMDDPTAAIDPETEKEIMLAMDSAMEGRATFIVAHRLSTLKRADNVIVLNKGRIIQSGTHAELIQIKGHYSLAASMQIPDAESIQILGSTDNHE